MKQSLKIKCEVPDRVHAGDFKVIYSNLVKIDDSLNFDYQTLIRGLKLLYPFNDLIINFQIL